MKIATTSMYETAKPYVGAAIPSFLVNKKKIIPNIKMLRNDSALE